MKQSYDLAKNILKVTKEIRNRKDFLRGPSYQNFTAFLGNLTQEKIVRQIRYLKFILRPILKHKGSILEVGSGYGLNLILLKFLGFRVVRGIEIVKEIHRNAALLIDLSKDFFPELERCHSILGDVQATNFADEQFSQILCIEALSHFPSRDRFLREANRMLQKEGYLIISDGNNWANPFYRKKRRRMWKIIREQELKKRLKFLKREWPEIDPQFRATLALHTELLSLKAIRKIVPFILSSEELPMNLYFEGYAPTFAETGIWDEWAFKPKELKQSLEKYGFHVQLKGYYGAARGFPFTLAQFLFNLGPKNSKFWFVRAILAYARKYKQCSYLL